MSDGSATQGGANAGGDGPAEAVVARRRRLSPIWLIPVVALAVAAGMAYRAIQERGPKVVVVFESAEGLEAGKSVVKYREVEVGKVDAIKLRDLDHVELHLSLDKNTAQYLTESTRWWVVRPRIGSGGITGLGTILSGAFVTFEAGKAGAAARRSFVGLEEPPLAATERPGLPIQFHAESLGGLDTGSPIFYRDLHVGEVLRYKMAKDGTAVDVDAIIETAYAGLVKKQSEFWNAGGVEISVGAGGLDVKTESLKSILIGGVAFDSPAGGDPAEKGSVFWLYRSFADAHATKQTHGGLGLVLEAGALGGVSPGNPVYYREMPVGAVVSHELSKDGTKVRVRINIEPRYEHLVRHNSVFWDASGISANLDLHGLHVHAESLKSLLSGGVAFATPPKPGPQAGEGSVFALHPQAKDDWQKWETSYEAPKEDQPADHPVLDEVGKFFHHEGKTEEQAKQDDPTPEPTPDEHKHHFLRGLFHRGK